MYFLNSSQGLSSHLLKINYLKVKNILHLIKQSWKYYALTFFSYSISFISIPILVKCLGISKYGNYELYLSISFLSAAFIDIGLTNFAIRESIKQDISHSRMMWNVTLIKSLILIGIISIFFLIVKFNFFGNYNYYLLFLSLILGFTRSIIPIWYFQVKELIGAWAISIAISQVATLFFVIFLLFYNAEIAVQYLLIINIIVNILVFLHFFFRISDMSERINIDIKYLVKIFKESTSLAPASILSTVYTYGSNILVATFAGSENLGTYALADRLHKSIVGTLGPLTQSYYPKMIQEIKLNFGSAKDLMIKIRNLFILISISIIICIWFLGDILVQKFAGSDYNYNTTLFLKILSLHILITALSRVYGYLWLVPNNEDKKFSYSVLLGSICYLLMTILLGPHFKIFGVIASFLLAEFSVLIMLIYTSYNLKR